MLMPRMLDVLLVKVIILRIVWLCVLYFYFLIHSLLRPYWLLMSLLIVMILRLFLDTFHLSVATTSTITLCFTLNLIQFYILTLLILQVIRYWLKILLLHWTQIHAYSGQLIHSRLIIRLKLLGSELVRFLCQIFLRVRLTYVREC
jgi:hypothetical protein